MPLDPSIPLGVLSPPAPNPLQALSAVAQLQAVRENAELRREQVEIRRQAAEAARTKAREQEQIDVAWQEAVSIDPVTGQTKVDRAKLKSQLPGHLWPSVDKELDL